METNKWYIAKDYQNTLFFFYLLDNCNAQCIFPISNVINGVFSLKTAMSSFVKESMREKRTISSTKIFYRRELVIEYVKQSIEFSDGETKECLSKLLNELNLNSTDS